MVSATVTNYYSYIGSTRKSRSDYTLGGAGHRNGENYITFCIEFTIASPVKNITLSLSRPTTSSTTTYDNPTGHYGDSTGSSSFAISFSQDLNDSDYINKVVQTQNTTGFVNGTFSKTFDVSLPSGTNYCYVSAAYNNCGTSPISYSASLYGTEADVYTIKYYQNASTGTISGMPSDGTISSGSHVSSDTPSRCFTVEFNPMGGVCTTEDIDSNIPFINWNTNGGGGGTSYSPGQTLQSVSASLDLFAQWGSASSINLPAAVRSGYTFLGWNTSSSAQSGMTGTYTPSNDVTLYAIWEEIITPVVEDDCIYLYVNGSWGKYVPYIYSGSSWHMASARIYSGSTWHRTGIINE